MYIVYALILFIYNLQKPKVIEFHPSYKGFFVMGTDIGISGCLFLHVGVCFLRMGHKPFDLSSQPLIQDQRKGFLLG